MKGDFSRQSFRADQNFSQVLLQQGRVLLDADFNEQGAIAAQALRRLTADLLGPHAGPERNMGFAITSEAGDLGIGYGRYYVDGIAAVNAPPPADQNGKISPLLLRHQAGYPFPGSLPQDELKTGHTYLLYLEVWLRHVTWLEDELVADVALEGRDTATRAKVEWRVLATEMEGAEAQADPEGWIEGNARRHSTGAVHVSWLPQLKAWTDPKDNPDDTPCVADPLGGYRGLENQLYRVEIHSVDPQTGDVTFKWSRENGSVVAAWVDMDGADLVVAGVHDTARGFAAGQWVEVSDERAQARGVPGVMLRLTRVDRNRLTYDPASVAGTLPQLKKLRNPWVRRWDQVEIKGQALAGGVLALKEGTDYSLERGIKVTFRKADINPARYRSGDYWLIPARTATADILWPYHTEANTSTSGLEKVYHYSEPDGIEYVYAPLAIVKPQAGNSPGFDITSLQRKINQLWSNV